jgi:hypothetical protein
MILVADSGALYALYDTSDEHHLQVRSAVDAHQAKVQAPLFRVD